jgi:hypothetical protein
VQIGDRVYNPEDATIALVTAIDDDTTLSLSDDIMEDGESYSIHRFDVSKGYKLFVGGTGNINCETAGGNEVLINGVPVGVTDFEVVHVKSTSTSATNIYVVF